MGVYQAVSSPSGNMQRVSYNEPVYNGKEEFDPALVRLNTVDKLSDYADSLYEATYPKKKLLAKDETYPDLVTSIVRKRFYHGYSLYGFNSNYMAMALAQLSVRGLSAIVVPDDILKYPYAACSQQSIILMKLLQNKGYSTRSVGFSSKITGHFTFETYYDGGWHYNDPNKEPNEMVLKAYNYPSIAFLNQHPDILVRAYPQFSKDYVLTVFTHYTYGTINTFPAPKAIIFQKVAKFLSYSLWAFFLFAFILVRRKYKKLKARPAITFRQNGFALQTSSPAPASAYCAA